MGAADPSKRASGVLYVDTSALVKLLIREPESAAIEAELLLWTNLATSAVTEVELPRAVARAREERATSVVDGSLVLLGIIESAAIVPLDEGVSSAAREVQPVDVGALDAIHIASATSFADRLAGVATYDKRMQHSLELLGVPIVAPS
jgi:hypothetical protein